MYYTKNSLLLGRLLRRLSLTAEFIVCPCNNDSNLPFYFSPFKFFHEIGKIPAADAFMHFRKFNTYSSFAIAQHIKSCF